MNEYKSIVVKGAREHNLKNIDVEIPRDAFVVITGLSGSGKSSLAFDTIYAEGQRRYVESLSAYARQFLGLMERPDVDYIEGLSPAISIEQKSSSHNPRSTVGTVTEIYDYLRLLFARVGTQFCTECDRKVQKQSTDQIIESVLALSEGTKIQVLAPVVRGRKGHYRELFEQIVKDGFLRVRIDGEVKEIHSGMKVDRYKIHNIEIVVDRIVVSKNVKSRINDSIETALDFGSGVVIVNDGRQDLLFSKHFSCPECGRSYDDPAPNSFSFNSPYGSCESCEGLGEKRELDLHLILPNEDLTINQEGIAPLGKPRQTWMFNQIRAVGKNYGFDFDTPIKKLSKKARQVLLYGGGDERFEIEYNYSSGRSVTYRHRFTGILDMLRRSYAETSSAHIREWIEAYMTTTTCEVCKGGRLKKDRLSIRLVDAKKGERWNIHDIVSRSIVDVRKLFRELTLTRREMEIARQILHEITQRLDFLLNVGLDYLTLGRTARSLSGGESQRIRLATQIGTQLVGVLYILDEPSIGLHQRDNVKLIRSLKNLRDLGNTVIVVEHDKETIMRADFIVDLGPGAGEHGGYLVASGSPMSIDGQSLTAQYIHGKRKIDVPVHRKPAAQQWKKELSMKISLFGASGNNLQRINVHIPLGLFVCITGVSGSGKSTLIDETLYRILSRTLYKSKDVPLQYERIEGLENIDKVINIDQSPIGRTPRSNPATYTGLFTVIRDLFTQLPESKIRGYKAGRYSFNVKGGRCDECEGDGLRKIEMNFLPDVYVICDVCKGKRYNRETLEGPIQREIHLGRSGNDRRGRSKLFFRDSPHSAKTRNTPCSRTRIYPAWTAGDNAQWW